MKFEIGNKGTTDVIVLFEDNETSVKDNATYKLLKERDIFNSKTKGVFFCLDSDSNNQLFVGFGKEKDVDFEQLRLAFHKVGKELMKNKIKDVNITIPQLEICYCKTTKAVVEGLLQANSVFDKYLTEKKVKPTLETVYFTINEEKRDKVEAGIKEMVNVFEGINITRALVNERPINMYPEILATEAVKALEPVGVKVTVYGEKEIIDMGMKAFQAVSLGSDKEPKFIVMNYQGNPASTEVTALVGKGLTYDSGGYSLKPAGSMDTMFTDMGGAGTVIGTMYAIAKEGLKQNVVGIVAACENLVDGSAYKPGDIIGSMAGKTIEVLNTDAEGRITLADALWYAATEVKATRVIDLATLTGACIVALGEITTAAITNDKKFLADVIDASELAGEPIWQLPTNDSYRELIKSDYADLANIGKNGAGTITAGLFLENFVDEKPWIHLDIAGTAYTKAARGYLPQGATGVHVKTLFNYINNLD